MANSMAVSDILVFYLAEIQLFFNGTGSTEIVEPTELQELNPGSICEEEDIEFNVCHPNT